MNEPNELALAQAEQDADELEFRGIARVPWGLTIQTEADAAVVVGAVQLRRDTAQRRRAQTEKLAAQEERDAERIEERYRGQLSAFTLIALAGQTVKSIALVTGQGGDKPTRMGFRNVPGGLRIVDKDKAMQWAAENLTSSEIEECIIVKQTQTPVAEAYKARFAETGEIPDGCNVVPDEQRFYIKPGN